MLKSSHQATNIIEKEVTFCLKTQRKRKNTSSNHDRLLLKPAKSQTIKKFNCELSVKTPTSLHYTAIFIHAQQTNPYTPKTKITMEPENTL